MPRLGFTLMSVLALVAAQETRITDPAAAASVENAQLYELIKAEYLAAGCEDAGWGPFPNVTSTPLSVEAYARAHGTSGCKCGMLYGLAHSSLSHEDDVAAMSRAAQGPASCANGIAAGFPCDGVDLIAHLPLSAFRTNTGEAPAAANDLWGWTHKKREFVIWGVSEGHFFVEVTDTPVVLAFVPSTDDRASVSSAGPSPLNRLTSCPSSLPWRGRRRLAHVPPPSLSFVLDVLSTSLVSVRTDPRGPRQ